MTERNPTVNPIFRTLLASMSPGVGIPPAPKPEDPRSILEVCEDIETLIARVKETKP